MQSIVTDQPKKLAYNLGYRTVYINPYDVDKILFPNMESGNERIVFNIWINNKDEGFYIARERIKNVLKISISMSMLLEMIKIDTIEIQKAMDLLLGTDETYIKVQSSIFQYETFDKEVSIQDILFT